MFKWKIVNVIESEAGSTDMMPDVLFLEEETLEKERALASGRVIFLL